MRRIPEQPLSRSKEYQRSYARKRRSEWNEEQHENHRAAVRKYWNEKGRFQRYGITKEQYEEALLRQGGKCAACLEAPHDGKFRIDHDHETGRFRALLCHQCNVTLGLVKDSPETLRRLADLVEGALLSDRPDPLS